MDVQVWVALLAGLAGACLGATVASLVALRQVRHVAEREVHRVGELLASRDQDWYWTPDWQDGEREAEADLAAGRTTVYSSEDDFLAALDEISAGRGSSPAAR